MRVSPHWGEVSLPQCAATEPLSFRAVGVGTPDTASVCRPPSESRRAANLAAPALTLPTGLHALAVTSGETVFFSSPRFVFVLPRARNGTSADGCCVKNTRRQKTIRDSFQRSRSPQRSEATLARESECQRLRNGCEDAREGWCPPARLVRRWGKGGRGARVERNSSVTVCQSAAL